MTWVRYDDNVRNHRKVESLDDATYRLWREAIEWCAQNLTDGVIRSHQITVTSIRASRPRAAKLVQCGLWHTADIVCGSEKCPPPGRDGWVIHDYWDYQPTAEAAKEDQAKARERKRRWLEAKKNGGKNGDGNAVPNGEPDAGNDGNPAPPRPAPKGRGGPTALQRSPAAVGGRAPAGGEAEDQNPRPSPPVPSNGRPDLAAAKAAIAEARARARRPSPAAGAMEALRAATEPPPLEAS